MLASIVKILLIVVFVASVTCDHCLDPVEDKNVCLYPGSYQIEDGLVRTNCQVVNGDTLSEAVGTLFFGDQGETCLSNIEADDDKCIKAWSRFICSAYCPEYASEHCTATVDVCQSICDSLVSDCPSADLANCFTNVGFSCTENTPCTEWEIKKSAISTSTTSKGNKLNSSLNLIHLFIVLFIVMTIHTMRHTT